MDGIAIINIGLYISLALFLIATIISATATDKFGKSTLGAVFTYLFIGTGILFVGTIYQKLGGAFFGISNDSLDVWYHVMFFFAVFSYHYGYQVFIGLGSGTVDGTKGWEKRWGLFSLVVILAIFFFSYAADPVIRLFAYIPLAGYGFLNIFSFSFAAIIGWHFLSVKENLGKIGQAIAQPIFLSLWAFALLFLWQLLTITYEVFAVSFAFEQGVEKTLLILASICVLTAALRLKAVAKS